MLKRCDYFVYNMQQEYDSSEDNILKLRHILVDVNTKLSHKIS